MQLRKNILVTGDLKDAMVNRIAKFHEVDVVPFIAISPNRDEQLKSNLASLTQRDLMGLH